MRRALSWCLAVGLCASILAALFVGESSAQGLAAGGLKSIALPSTISGDKTFTGDITIQGNDLTASGTGQTFNVVSATSASTATSSVAAMTFAPSATLDANDLIVDWQSKSSGGTSLFKFDLEGDTTVAGQVNMVAEKKICFDGAANCFGSIKSDVNGVIAVAGASIYLGSGTDINQAVNTSEILNNGSNLGVYVNDVDGLCVGDGTGNQTIPTTCDGKAYAAFAIAPVQADTTGGSFTLTPTSANIELNPASAATVTLGETGMLDGMVVQITNIHASNAATFADTAGVTELKGPFTMNQYDSLTLRYVSDRWVETERSVNNGGTIQGSLSADVTVDVNATYVNVFSVTPPASKNVTLLFRLMYVPSANTIGEQITVESADAANGNCAFTTYGISGTAASATVNEYDILAIQSSGTSTDTAAAAACNTTACPLEVLCTLITDASPQAVILKAQLETGTTNAPIKAGSFYTMTTN